MSQSSKTKKSSKNLSESYAHVRIPENSRFWRKLFAFSGPGLLVAVGYMDPGNWATDLAGGAQFGYKLLWVVLLSNFMAMLLQHLSLKLGIVSGRDLAQSCRDSYSRPWVIFQWILCEIAIIACDLAEVIGSAIALNLLFKIPLSLGIILTSLDVFIILYLQNKGFRFIEAFVGALIVVIAACFAYEIAASQPQYGVLLKSLLPNTELFYDKNMLYIAIGILGATVMPHNLYLHSSIVQTRAFTKDFPGKKEAIAFATLDSTLALTIAFFVNAAILVLSATVFHQTEHQNIVELSDAYHLLSPVMGAPLASTLFAVALLASGHNSTLTGTMAGQIVMEGYLDLKMKPWKRRLLTRSIALIPALLVIYFWGHVGISKLLILSQVVLSIQLSFAVIPLIQFTSDSKKMGEFKNKIGLNLIAWSIALTILVANLFLLVQIIF